MPSVEFSNLVPLPPDVEIQPNGEFCANTSRPEPPALSYIEQLYKMGHRETVLSPGMPIPLPALIHSAGFREENKPTYDCDGCRRGNIELGLIQYTLSGRGRLRFQDREMIVEPGQVMLLQLPQKHRYWIQEGERWEFFYVLLSGSEAVRGIRQINERIGPLVTLAESSPALERAAKACLMALEGKIDSPYRSSELAWSIMMGLLADPVIDTGKATPAIRTIPTFVVDVEKFCQTNLARPIGVDDMARVAKMSRFHFSRQFERARGISPGRYLASLRLEEAMRLIASSQFTVKKVAEECGFGDANYFCKVFRKSFGVSPGAYRAGVA